MNQQRQFQHQLTGSAAELYERYVVPYLFAAWAQELVEQMDLRPGERVLDVACGTGIVARNAAEKVGTSGTVTGLDINPGMLAVASNLRLPAGTPSIQWVECSALDMQLEDASFDVVLCEQGFQFFPDKSVALKEMRRVLVPRGRLAISVWFGPSPYNIAMANGIERHLGPEAGKENRSSRIAPSVEEITNLVTDAGFNDVKVTTIERIMRFPLPEEYLPLHLAALPVSTQFAAMDEESRAGLINDIATELRPFVSGNELVFPDAINMATAKR